MSISDVAALLFVLFWMIFGLTMQRRDTRDAQAERDRLERVAALYPRRR